MLIEILLRLIGDDPANYPIQDRFPTFSAHVVDRIFIPLIYLFLLILPFFIAIKIFKKLTKIAIVVCIVIGLVLVYLGYLA
ncbi:MAG: hypothetical protein ABIP54_04670, partial [Candidatus Andersenbacteria bacterium]